MFIVEELYNKHGSITSKIMSSTSNDYQVPRPFEYSELADVAGQFGSQLQRDLQEGTSQGFMQPTLLTVQASERSCSHNVMAYEVGGSNMYAASVLVEQTGSVRFKSPISEAPILVKDFSGPESFLDAVLDISPSVEARDVDMLALVFSYFGEPRLTGHGVDFFMTRDRLEKNLTISGLSNRYLGHELTNRLAERVPDHVPSSCVVLNDAPAVLLSRGAGAGVVVGSGFNMSLAVDGTVYNTEAGRFSPKFIEGLSGTVRGEISGFSIADKLRAIIDGLAQTAGLSYAEKPISSRTVSDIILGNKIAVQRALGLPLTGEMWLQLEGSAAGLRSRSAQMVGALIGGAMLAFPHEFENRTEIPIEGSVVSHMPGYQRLATWAIREISGHDNVTLKATKHASLLGAARAAVFSSSK